MLVTVAFVMGRLTPFRARAKSPGNPATVLPAGAATRVRLFASPARRISAPMRLATLLFAGLGSALAGQPACGQSLHHSAHALGQPVFIGKFADWQAASHQEGGVAVCYIFTRAEAPVAQVPGRGDVVLSVTRREGDHDSVALSAGFMLTGHEDAVLQAGGTKLLFYIAGRSAFSRDNAAAVKAFGHEFSVAAHVHGPKGAEVIDHFGLKGFASAYAAMLRSCAKAPPP